MKSESIRLLKVFNLLESAHSISTSIIENDEESKKESVRRIRSGDFLFSDGIKFCSIAQFIHFKSG